MIYNTTPYWYVKTVQGDIIAIKDSTGADVVRYSYNAWGKVTVNRDTSGFNLAYRNPFFYRGYFYDYDTKLYYLNSRYYDPELGRFLNADEPELLMFDNCPEYNLYVYSLNDPVNKIDITGAICTDFDYKQKALILNVNVELGDGWSYRIDSKNTPNEHIHLFHKNKRKGWYAQNKDGSIHDKNKNGPNDGPPSKPKRKLKEKAGWDWDEKAKEYEQKEKNNKYSTKPIKSYAEAAGWAALGYAIYRVVRFGVSLFPPLWPTLPINAIVP